MESADADLQALGAELPGEVDRARILVRLDADEPDQRSPAPALEIANDLARHDAAVGLVVGLDGEIDAGPQHLPTAGVLGEAVHARERVGRHDRAEPLNRIALVVVMGRLDENEGKTQLVGQ